MKAIRTVAMGVLVSLLLSGCIFVPLHWGGGGHGGGGHGGGGRGGGGRGGGGHGSSGQVPLYGEGQRVAGL